MPGAKIGDIDYTGFRTPAVQPFETVSPALAAQTAGGMGEAVGEGIQAVGQLLKKRADVQAETDVADAVASATDKLQDLRIKLQSDPDTTNRHAKYVQAATEIADNSMAGLDYKPARDAFKRRFAMVSTSVGTEIKVGAAEEEKQVNRLKLDDNNANLLNKALFAPSPQERAAYLQNVRDNIDGAVSTGLLSAPMAHQRLHGELGKFDVATADQMIRANPQAAMTALKDPEQFKYLDAVARTKLMSQAQARSESLSLQAKAEWQFNSSQYQQARAAGQPVDPDLEAKLFAQAKTMGPVAAQQFASTKRFYDRVDEYAPKSLPELREAAVSLGQGSLEDKQVGRAVSKMADHATREQSKSLREMLGEWSRLRDAGEKPDNLSAILDLASDVGGPTMRDSIEATNRMYDRVNFAREKLGAEGIRQNIDAIRTDRRDAQGGQLSLEDVHEIGALHAALDIKEKEAKRDPAGYVLKYYPTVNDAFADAGKTGNPADFARAAEAMLAAQAREGIAPALLAKPVADRLEAKLNSPDINERIAAVSTARDTFGPKFWPVVKGQLNQGANIPPETEVMASLPPGAVLNKAKMVEAFRLKEEEWSKALGPEKGDIDQSVRDKGAEILKSFALTPGGPTYGEAFNVAARRIAYLNRQQGQSASKAVANAWDEVFNQHWQLVDGVRVPKVEGQPIVDPDRLKTLQQLTVRNLPKMDLLDPVSPAMAGLSADQRKAQLARAVQSFGFWVSDADERGAYLFAGPNQPVRTADGKPVHIGFDQLQGAAWDAIMTKAVAAFRGRLQ